jgi:predicted small integral membrane protein
MMAARWAKIAMVLSLALFAFLVVFTNITDHGGNAPFVSHVLSMDTTFRSPAVAYRAIDVPWIWAVAYWAIIAGEALTCVLLVAAGFQLLAARNAPALSSTGRSASCTPRRWRAFLSGSSASWRSGASGS